MFWLRTRMNAVTKMPIAYTIHIGTVDSVFSRFLIIRMTTAMVTTSATIESSQPVTMMIW